MQRSAEHIIRGEIIGHTAHVVHSTDPGHVGRQGRVVDETRHTLIIRTTNGARTVPKRGATFTITTDIGSVNVPGDAIEHRPEDRIKKARLRA